MVRARGDSLGRKRQYKEMCDRAEMPKEEERRRDGKRETWR